MKQKLSILLMIGLLFDNSYAMESTQEADESEAIKKYKLLIQKHKKEKESFIQNKRLLTKCIAGFQYNLHDMIKEAFYKNLCVKNDEGVYEYKTQIFNFLRVREDFCDIIPNYITNIINTYYILNNKKAKGTILIRYKNAQYYMGLLHVAYKALQHLIFIHNDYEKDNSVLFDNIIRETSILINDYVNQYFMKRIIACIEQEKINDEIIEFLIYTHNNKFFYKLKTINDKPLLDECCSINNFCYSAKIINTEPYYDHDIGYCSILYVMFIKDYYNQEELNISDFLQDLLQRNIIYDNEKKYYYNIISSVEEYYFIYKNDIIQNTIERNFSLNLEFLNTIKDFLYNYNIEDLFSPMLKHEYIMKINNDLDSISRDWTLLFLSPILKDSSYKRQYDINDFTCPAEIIYIYGAKKTAKLIEKIIEKDSGAI